MKIIIRYSVITKEGTVVPNVIETFRCETEEEKKPARERWLELKSSLFIANLEYRIEEIPSRRVVRVKYAPKGTVYTFEVDFDVRPHEGLEVDDLDHPGRRVYVVAVEKDRVVPESDLGFDVQRLRCAYRIK